MKINRLILLAALAAFGGQLASAQNKLPPDAGGRPSAPDAAAAPDADRPRLMLELGLSSDQIQQVRRIYAESRPQMRTAQSAFRDATKALDAAIYADFVDEAAIANRIRELQAAQAEVARVRFGVEVAIRKILTPEQLGRFREVRRRFEEQRSNFRMRRREPRRLPSFQQMTRPDQPPKSSP